MLVAQLFFEGLCLTIRPIYFQIIPSLELLNPKILYARSSVTRSTVFDIFPVAGKKRIGGFSLSTLLIEATNVFEKNLILPPYSNFWLHV